MRERRTQGQQAAAGQHNGSQEHREERTAAPAEQRAEGEAQGNRPRQNRNRSRHNRPRPNGAAGGDERRTKSRPEGGRKAEEA